MVQFASGLHLVFALDIIKLTPSFLFSSLSGINKYTSSFRTLSKYKVILFFIIFFLTVSAL